MAHATTRIDPGNTGKYAHWFANLGASSTESFPMVIERVLNYANALLQNGYRIVKINLKSGQQRLNTTANFYVGSRTTGEIIYEEYTSTGGPVRVPIHARWWETIISKSDSAIIAEHMLTFRNKRHHVIVDESNTTFTPFTQKIKSALLYKGVFNLPESTEDVDHSVLWYCDTRYTAVRSRC